MNVDLDNLIAKWARLGAGFWIDRAEAPVDLEYAIVGAATVSPQSPRLFAMVVTWLTRFGDLVDQDQLSDLATQLLNDDDRTHLALLLDMAQSHPFASRFDTVLARLTPASEPGPMFAVERDTPTLWDRARRRACPVSLRWNRWCDPIEPKYDALMDRAWVLRHNPELARRAAAAAS